MIRPANFVMSLVTTLVSVTSDMCVLSERKLPWGTGIDEELGFEDCMELTDCLLRRMGSDMSENSGAIVDELREASNNNVARFNSSCSSS